MPYVAMGNDKDSDSFHDQDERLLRVKIEPRRTYLHVHVYGPNDHIDKSKQSRSPRRPHDLLRFDTITTTTLR